MWQLFSLFLVCFCFGQIYGIIEELNSVNFDDKLATDKSNWLVMFRSEWCGKHCEDFDPILKKLADTFPNQLHIGQVSHKDFLIRRFDVQVYPTLLYFRKGKYYTYTHSADFEDLKLFCAGDFKHNTEREIPPPLNDSEQTWLQQLDDGNFESKVLAKRGAYWAVLFMDNNYEGYKGVKQHIESVAKQLAGKINVAVIDGKKNVGSFVRLEIKHTPTLYVIRGGKGYKMGDEFSYTYEDMSNFIEGGFEKAKTTKEIKPTVQPGADENPNSEVITLTDENFDKTTQVMTGKGGMWFIEFYAPWCGHCKALAPIWEDIAIAMRERLHVGKVDCVANKNSSERFHIPGFPILLLFKGGKYYQYNGKQRTAEAIIEWVTKNYKEQDGIKVPPPFGQPLPPPTPMEQLEQSAEFIQAMWQFNNEAFLGIVGCGMLCGSGLVLYMAVLVMALRPASRPPPMKQRRDRQHGAMPMQKATANKKADSKKKK